MNIVPKYFLLLFFVTLISEVYGQKIDTLPSKTTKDSHTIFEITSKSEIPRETPLLQNNEIDINIKLSVFALIIAAVSLIVSFFTYKIQRTHNIKSLKPFIIVHPYDYEDHIKIEIKNQGTGVAVITSLKVIKGDENKPNIFKWLPEKLTAGLNYEDYFLGGLGDFALSPNNSINFLEIKFDKSLKDQIEIRNKIRSILSELTIEISYHDVYENIYNFNRDLSFFSRIDNENSEIEMIKLKPEVRKKSSIKS